MRPDVIVIGGGAAGLFAAITAGRRGRRVLVIEHNDEVGRKIIISGGGRCNFTNINTSHENFISRNPHFAKSALARFSPQDFVELVTKHKIAFYEKKLGQLFCRERSHQIVEMLLAECKAAKVKVETNCSVRSVAKNGRFIVDTTKGSFECESLVVATGGLSFPKIGATDLGYRIAKQFGLKIEPTRPSLVPLVFTTGKELGKLAGISVDTAVTSGGHSFRENILFTHRGLSGPAILQASNYWTAEETMDIDLAPDMDVAELLSANTSSRKLVVNFLSELIPHRVAEAFAAGGLPNKPLDQLSSKEIETIGRSINDWRVRFKETEGWHKAEVTLGGVSTSGLSSQAMEAKKVPGLYFIGELIDVTGWLGGYNFQWAWASGFAAGRAV